MITSWIEKFPFEMIKDRPAKKDISIIGLGRLGVPLAACYALQGFNVTGIDVDSIKVKQINEAALNWHPTQEPGVAEILKQVVTAGKLFATTSHEMIAETDATIIIVNTPAETGNAYSLEYIFSALEGVGAAIKAKDSYHLVMISSTVMPGTTAGIIRAILEKLSGKPVGEAWGLCYVPEFLAVGTAIPNILTPQFVLIGADDPKAFIEAHGILRDLTGICEMDKYAQTSIVNAEIAKIAANTAHVMKISLANQWARICSHIPGADIDEVTAVIGMDSRIGPALLKGSLAYGGPCFARDSLAWEQISLKTGVPIDIPRAIGYANDRASDYLLSRIPIGKSVAILGVAYKPGVSWAVESLGVALAGKLLDRWESVTIHDPMAADDAWRHLEHFGERVVFSNRVEDAIERSGVVVICTPWPIYSGLEPKWLTEKIVIDCWRIVDHEALGADTKYIAIGRA